MTSTSLEVSVEVSSVSKEYQTLLEALSAMISMTRDMNDGVLTLSLRGTLLPLTDEPTVDGETPQ